MKDETAIKRVLGDPEMTYLAKSWERAVSMVEYPTKIFACGMLLELGAAFIRGQGLRLGSRKGVETHGLTFALKLVLVVERVLSEPAKEIWFPTLTKLGFNSQEEVLQLLRQFTTHLQEEA